MTWLYFWNGINFAIAILVGTTVFGMNIFTVNWFTFIVILLVGIVAMWGMSIIGVSIELVTKQGNPLSWFLSAFSFLVSGLYYSPEALLTFDSTGILYGISRFLPHTYIYHMTRLAFTGKSILDMLSPLLTLLIMAATFFIIGWFTFRICLRKCQQEGSIGWV
jgi:ABC-type multidrug transport system permease subunit